MAKKLYVGNLSYGVTEEKVQELFAPHGAVESVKFIKDRDSGRFKGFGFVEMADDDGAQKAISALNGQEYEGRRLVVSEAHDKPPRQGGGGGFGGGGRGGHRGGGGGGYRGDRGGGGGGGYRGDRGDRGGNY